MHRRIVWGSLLLLSTAGAAGAQTWQPVPLVTRAARQVGHSGGEGAQWPRALAADSLGRFVLFGTDVGGLFRSRDGGTHWEPCNVGYTPRGTCGLAIDPHNPRRCLSVGANSVASDFHGVWLSTDGASSWMQALKINLSGSHDSREQLAYDPATYDAHLGGTAVVYWSRIAKDDAMWGGSEQHPALYKSTDGGQTWAEVPNTAAVGGSILRVPPTGHDVYAANGSGFRRSGDGGQTFEQTLTGDIQGLDVSAAAPGVVFVSKADGVWRSSDRGRTWAKLPGSLPLINGDPLRGLKVSPADPARMALWREGANYQWTRFFTSDGGATWHPAAMDSAGAFLPGNARQALCVWDPKNPQVAWSTGGDWPTKSTDGGATWRYAGDGDNGILVGGAWSFNVQNPDVLFVGSQDYNGAVTTDGGRTWRYTNVSGNGWGGFTYGGYAASASVLYVGNAAGWGSPRVLTVSRDGGATWKSTGLSFSGPDASFGDPADPKVLFASNLRSADGGATWTPMAGCDGVFAASPFPVHRLYGRLWYKSAKQCALRVSRDGGASWTTLATLPAPIDDIAADPRRSRLYVVSDSSLKVWQGRAWETVVSLPKDQGGGSRVSSVATDPTDPAIVYVACHRDVFSTSAAVLRSTDAGKTWQNLTLNAPLAAGQVDGGREAIWVRVHPRTRAAYVSTSCYGLWKIGPPPLSSPAKFGTARAAAKHRLRGTL